MTGQNNLVSSILYQINRAREILTMYEEIPQGVFGAMVIKQAIKRAEESIASGDVVQMIASFKELNEIE